MYKVVKIQEVRQFFDYEKELVKGQYPIVSAEATISAAIKKLLEANLVTKTPSSNIVVFSCSLETNEGTGGNTGDNVGSVQSDEFKSHRHSVFMGSIEKNGGMDPGGYPQIDKSELTEDTASDTLELNGGNETRMKNIYVHCYIKY